jgi:hypothetical protein
MSPELLDQADEFVGFAALGSSVVEEVSCAFDEGALFGGAGDGDTPAASEFEQAFVAELAEGAQDGVGVNAEDRSEVLRRREAFPRLRLAFGDRPADLGCDLCVEVGRVGPVDLDTKHGASDTSATVQGRPRWA